MSIISAAPSPNPAPEEPAADPGSAPSESDQDEVFESALEYAEEDEDAEERQMVEMASVAVDQAVSSGAAAGVNVPSAALAGAEPPAVAVPAVNPAPDPADAGHAAAVAHVQEQQAEVDQEDRNFNLNRWGVIFGAVSAVIAIASLIYAIIKGSESSANDALDSTDPVIPPDVAAKVHQAVAAYGVGHDAAYWNHLADYVEQADASANPFTLGDEVLFMGYTMDCWPDTGNWMWPAAADRAKVVEDLVAAYKASQSTAAMYRLVTTYTAPNASTGQPEVMPRAVAADRLQTALAVLIYPPEAQ